MNVLLIGLAFVLGSFPSGVVLSQLLTGQDVRRAGSGNIGAANVARTAGFRVGAGVALLDIVKGILPVLIGKQMGLGQSGLALVALAAVLGHDFSLFLRFRGGKGVATTLGVALVLAPLGTVFAAAGWILTLAVWGYASLASLAALGLLPVLIGLTGGPPAYVVLASALFGLAVAKHWENIVRLAHGRESRLRRRPDAG